MRVQGSALAFLLLICASPCQADDQGTVTARFAQLRTDPLRLEMFLREMPKGGDLHNHLDGAVYAESYLRHAEAAGLCIAADAIRPCRPGLPTIADALRSTPGLWDRMVDALSMRDFVPTADDRSGHDHFFSTFAKFEPAADDTGAMLAEEASRAAGEHVSYLEIIALPELREAIAAGRQAAWHGDDFAADLAAVRPALEPLVAQARAHTDAAETRMRALLGCDTKPDAPGCQVIIRYQGFALRTLEPRAVFAQLAFEAMLAHADTRYVGLNIVAPEDDPVALADYTLHMRMLGFLHDRDHALHLSLHAGELVPGMVPPEALRFHIREAIEIAGAERIGHGVDVAYETDAPALLREMAARGVAVEINETSNEQILGVTGTDHPFGLYRASGVPVVLCTDDEGVSRIDLTHEYVRAARIWHLGYRELKALSHASLQYSFLPAAEKARAQAQLDGAFTRFERRIAAAPR